MAGPLHTHRAQRAPGTAVACTAFWLSLSYGRDHVSHRPGVGGTASTTLQTGQSIPVNAPSILPRPPSLHSWRGQHRLRDGSHPPRACYQMGTQRDIGTTLCLRVQDAPSKRPTGPHRPPPETSRPAPGYRRCGSQAPGSLWPPAGPSTGLLRWLRAVGSTDAQLQNRQAAGTAALVGSWAFLGHTRPGGGGTEPGGPSEEAVPVAFQKEAQPGTVGWSRVPELPAPL